MESNQGRKCKLSSCGKPFTPAHDNETYCRREHQYIARKIRQRLHREIFKKFIPIYIRNNEIMAGLFAQNIAVLTVNDIEVYGIDVSLCRYCYSTTGAPEEILMDFGAYSLTTDKTFTTFKLSQNEANNNTV